MNTDEKTKQHIDAVRAMRRAANPPLWTCANCGHECWNRDHRHGRCDGDATQHTRYLGSANKPEHSGSCSEPQ
jgi:hypothetical protein